MKEFDFVKFTLVLVGVLTLGVAGVLLWARSEVSRSEADLRVVKSHLVEIGQHTAQLDYLQQQRAQDRLLGKPAGTYLAEQARTVGLSSNVYKFNPKQEQNKKTGVVEEHMVLDFKPGGKLSRDRLFGFIYHVEQNSPGIKLVKLDLKLDERAAEANLWSANMTFMRQRAMTEDERLR